MYHFLSGYTAKVAGTEKGVTEPQATFSTCFGAPFMPRHPSEYGNLLRDYINKNQVDCWLVSTGYTGGPYGEGHRMPIKVTRALLRAALDGSLKKVETSHGSEISASRCRSKCRALIPKILRPRDTWANGAPMTAKRQNWSRCSTTTSRPTWHMSMKTCSMRRLCSPKRQNSRHGIAKDVKTP